MTATRRRLGLLCLLCGALLVLMVWFGSLAPAPALGDYPDTGQVATNAEQYRGAHVVVSGPVRTIDPVTIAAGDGTGRTVELTITGLTSPVRTGDQLRVYGVLTADRTIHAHEAVTVPRWGHWYTYVVSVLAGCWVLVRIGRDWQINTHTWPLEPRPLSVDWRTLVRRASTDETEPDDA